MSKLAHRISRRKVAALLVKRAESIEQARAPDRVQPHSKQLPTEIELAEARYASRQLRIAAGEILAGLEN